MGCQKDHSFSLYNNEICPVCEKDIILDILTRLKINYQLYRDKVYEFTFAKKNYLIGRNINKDKILSSEICIICVHQNTLTFEKDIWNAIKAAKQFAEIGIPKKEVILCDQIEEYTKSSIRRFAKKIPVGVDLAIGYVRVSTEEQVENGFSLENQVDKIYNYAVAKGFFIKEIYEDRGISAKTIKERKSLVNLLENIKPKDTVIVAYFNRLSRTTKDAITIVETINEKKGSVVFMDLDIDTRTHHGRMIMGMQAVMAQFEREQISVRVRDTMNYMSGNDKLINRPKYGWKKNEIKGQPQIKHEQEQAVIEKIRDFKLKNPLSTVSDMMKFLNNSGVVPRTGRKWSHSMVSRIMEQNDIEITTREVYIPQI